MSPSMFDNLISNPWLAFYAVIGLITFYWLKWGRAFSYWSSRNIRTPTPIPIFGTTLFNYLKNEAQIQLDWYTKFGRIYGTYQIKKPFLMVAEPDLVKQILVKDFHSFRSRGEDSGKHPIISKNMFLAKYEDWKRIRTIATPTFTSGKLRKMYSLISMCCTDFLDDLEQKIKIDNEIELKQLMGTFTMDVIARCAFGSKTNTYKDPNNEFTTRAQRIFNRPWWRNMLLQILPGFITRIQLVQHYMNMRENSLFFIDFAAKVIKYRRNNNKNHNDFLQLLMDAERTDDQHRDESNATEAHHMNAGTEEIKADKEAFSNVTEKKLTENEILAQCFLFFIAGYETTSSTLSHCAYELALHPEIQQRLFEETKDAFDENGQINYEVLSKLPFLDAVLSETLRHYPPFLALHRVVTDEIVLGGLKLEKGIVAGIPIYAMHHDPTNFPDPFEFNPGRFLPENRDQIKPYTYLPFGAGPRNCIGMRFALLESKLALARFIQKFKVIKVANTEEPLVFKKTKLIVGFEKR